MAFFTDCVLYDLLIIVLTLVITFVSTAHYKVNYWKRKGIPYLPAQIPFKKKRSRFEEVGEFYTYFKSRKERHGGIYIGTRPVYLPIDNALVKAIFQTDFNHFMNHGQYINVRDDPLSGHLFNLENDSWKNMRNKITPTFTSGKIKYMFQTLADCSIGLTKIINKAAETKSDVDIKDVLGRFTTDVIGSAAFGIECNSLENPDSEFRKYGKKVSELSSTTALIKYLLIKNFPHSFLRFLRITSTEKDVSDFFLTTVKEVVEHREKNNIQRKDFLQLLLQLKNKKNDTNEQNSGLTLEELSAQSFVFFIAGFETSSTTMAFTLYELAINHEMQQKLRDEINEVLVKHNGKITYEAIQEMTYMDKIFSETLRKYPPVAFLNRMCNKDWPIPNTNIVLEKGTAVGFLIKAIHYDPEYYPNPEVFDPERFTEEAKKSRPGYTWLPFGEGPRQCIGLRFGLMQSKVGLTAILKNYLITLSKKTNLPLEMEPFQGITSVKGGIWINVEKIE